MAIAFDATSEGSVGSGTTLTVAHTISGSNTLLLVHVLSNELSDTITGVTYNSVAMTKLITQASSTGDFAWVFSLIAPATGTNNIVVTFPGLAVIGVQAISYTGVSQTGFPDAQTSASFTGSPWSAAITTIADNCWHFLAIRTDSISTWTSGGTRRLSANFGGVQTTGDSNTLITPAGSHTITGTATVTVECYKMSVSFAPAVASTNSNFFLFF